MAPERHSLAVTKVKPAKARAKPRTPSKRGQANSAAARVLSILEAVADCEEPVAAVDLVPKVNLPKPTVHRLAVMLERLGFLQREPGSKRFTTGSRQEAIALNTLINSSWRGPRHAILQSLVDKVGETCNVTVLDGNEVVYIDRVESHWPLRTHFQSGSRIPIHCGASGKLFLSLMPAHKRRKMLTSAPLRKYTENTITNLEKLEENLKQIRATRIGLDDQEFLHGLVGVAVPVLDIRGRICATVSMHAPTVRLNAEQALKHAPAMRRAAEAITRLLSSTKA